jgi:hypothetical protein
MSAIEPAAMIAALEALLDKLDDGAVRDLAWLIFSPPLLQARPPLGQLASPFETVDEAVAIESWLLALDHDAEPLRQAMAAARLTRLGRYAECLLAYFLEHGPAPRLIAANVALRRAGRTLGECDFLVETTSGRRLHWELAVKYYLHAGGGLRASLADFVGPNLQDRFDLKLARLLGHQLPLSARDEFAALGHAGPWEAQMFVKGWLFYRWEEGAQDGGAQDGARPPVSDDVDPRHAHGFWVTREQWTRFAAQYGSGDMWAELPRLAWLAPRRSLGGCGGVEVPGLTAPALAERLAQHSGPTMVAALALDNRDGRAPHWRECARGFVVPDDWPERARAFAGNPYHQR